MKKKKQKIVAHYMYSLNGYMYALYIITLDVIDVSYTPISRLNNIAISGVLRPTENNSQTARAGRVHTSALIYTYERNDM